MPTIAAIFRFAIQTSSAPDAKAWRDKARRIEALGYSTLFMPDHFGDQWAPTVALTVAAEATTTLNVGALVYDNDYRHPVVLAKDMATLDLVSDGRLEVGLGAGWMRSDYDEAGMAYDEPSVRVDRMEEAIAVLKALWTEGTCTYEGRHYHIADAKGLPRPARQPHPPLLIGGGSKRVLSIAGREAQIVGINPSLKAGYIGPEVAATVTAEHYARRVQWVREAAGDRFDDIELQVLTFLCRLTNDRDGEAARLAPLFGLSPEAALEAPLALVGDIDQLCDTLVERRERYGFSYWVFHDDEIDDFAPLVERLAGT